MSSPQPGSPGPASTTTFSVVIPAYNAASTIGACVERLRSCHGRPDQLVVVDDASTDATAEIAEQLGAEVIRKATNRGAGAARNTGSAATTSEIVVFVDADVLVPPDTFTRLREHFAQPQSPAVISAVYSDECPAVTWFARHKNLYSAHMLVHLSDWVSTLNTCMAAIKRDVLNSYGGFDPRWPAGEDTELAITMAASGERLIFDHAIAIEHLKELTLTQLLSEDWKKSYWLARQVWARGIKSAAKLRSGQRNHHGASAFAALATSWMILAGLVVLLFLPTTAAAGFLTIAIAAHVSINWSYYTFVAAHEGAAFAAAAAALHWIQLLSGGTAVIIASIDGLRSRSHAVGEVNESR